MGLGELQRAMRDALRDGDTERLLARIADAPIRTRSQQLGIYEGMFFARQVEALKQDFPRLVASLGDNLFSRVAITHIKQRPSKHPSLAFLGRGLETTLVNLGLAAEASIARLECARNEAFWAPPGAAIGTADLAALGEDFGAAVLSFHPSLQLLTVARVERATVAGSVMDGTEIEPGQEQVAVWRHDYTLLEAVLPPLEASALSLALRGAAVSEVLECFVHQDAPESAALEIVLGWVSRGWIVSTAIGGLAIR